MVDALAFLTESDRAVLARLRSEGKAWIVGGWVRESLRGEPNTDLDIATDLHPSAVRKLFPRSIPVGEAYGTIMVRLDSGEEDWEVTTLRSEGSYGDGRRPDVVEFGDSIYDDLARRDFTINAMALDANGTLIDEFDGLSDLENGVLRSVGQAGERLGEDGLRIMRAFRFLDDGERGLREMDEELSIAVSDNLGMLDKVSRERIGNELMRILAKRNRAGILCEMKSAGVLSSIVPEIDFDLEIDYIGSELVILAKICQTFNGSGEEFAKICRDSFRFSKAQTRLLSFLHDNRHAAFRSEITEIRRFRAALNEEQQTALLDYHQANDFRKALTETTPLKAGNAPLVSGERLMETTGLEAGVRLGRLKAWLHRRQIEDDLETAEEVLDLLDSINWQEGEPADWPTLAWP